MIIVTIFIVLAVTIPGLEGVNKCYGDLGCFNPDDFFNPTYRPIMTAPEDRETVNTKFLLYTRRHHVAQFLQTGNASSLAASHFQSDRPTKIIIHGYTDFALERWIQEMRDALLAVGDFNILSVDWPQGSRGLYDKAAANTWVVGGELALLIQFLCDEGGARLSEFHLIGHSLGAHVAGYVGSRLRGLGRITGLDPAALFFQGTPAPVRLDVTDADFVDVVHTDSIRSFGLTQFESGFGMRDPVGHIDFYPNGGNDQPGCDNLFVDQLWTALTGNFRYVACDHRRASLLLIDSINSRCDMVAFPCDNYHDFQAGLCSHCGPEGCGVIGMKAEKFRPPAGMTNIKYFLNTGAKKPYCRRHLIVSATLSSESDRESGTIEMGLGTEQSYHRITLSPEELDAGATYRSSLETTSAQDLRHLAVWFTFQPTWWNPFTWFGTHHIRLNKIELFLLELQTSIMFCGHDVTLSDRAGPTFLNVSSAC